MKIQVEGIWMSTTEIEKELDRAIKKNEKFMKKHGKASVSYSSQIETYLKALAGEKV